jgi:hypothetical protein
MEKDMKPTELNITCKLCTFKKQQHLVLDCIHFKKIIIIKIAIWNDYGMALEYLLYTYFIELLHSTV